MDIRRASTAAEVAQAIAVDRALPGAPERADYIRAVAERGGLSLAHHDGKVGAFCCLDHRYFFEKPFVSLLIVATDARRLGLGAALLARCARDEAALWTSTNRSNAPMRALLDKARWRSCGELSGLDPGDPERFYRRP